MSQIFNSPERPFYQSTVSMGLEPLNEEIYYDFARRFFEGKKGCISQEIFHHIYQLFDGVTRNIQLMLNRLYETEKKVCSESQIKEAIIHIVNQSSMQYEELLNLLSDNQQALMKAIAKEGSVATPQGDTFIKRYNLPSSSSVKTALDVLLDKDLIYRTQTGYIIYDYFFALLNFTEVGVGIMPLAGACLKITPEKLWPDYDGFIFYYYQELADITAKNFYGIRKSVKTVTITLANKAKLCFTANMEEKALPYQINGMNKFVGRYQK
jgi:predicted transcriptional regulator